MRRRKPRGRAADDREDERSMRRYGIAMVLILAVLTAFAQRPANPPPAGNPAQGEPAGGARPAPPAEAHAGAEPEPVVTHHQINAGGKTLRYTATTGRMPIKNA